MVFNVGCGQVQSVTQLRRDTDNQLLALVILVSTSSILLLIVGNLRRYSNHKHDYAGAGR